MPLAIPWLERSPNLMLSLLPNATTRQPFWIPSLANGSCFTLETERLRLSLHRRLRCNSHHLRQRQTVLWSTVSHRLALGRPQQQRQSIATTQHRLTTPTVLFLLFATISIWFRHPTDGMLNGQSQPPSANRHHQPTRTGKWLASWYSHFFVVGAINTDS